DALINVVLVVEEPLDHDGAASVLALDGPALSRHFARLPMARDLRALIEAGANWRHWPLFIRPQLERWSHGPVTLLGDAAHPMPPFLAQGAAQAIEDAEALGRAFNQFGATAKMAFSAYERARMARACKVVAASRRQGGYFHMRPPASYARDLAIRLLGGPGMLRRNAWLYR
ncbi:MAG: FAD-dependent monooxygenase, partial [Methylocystis sp.]|nr:FAD-dependent monooxygenase [Methylocystis sp.]